MDPHVINSCVGLTVAVACSNDLCLQNLHGRFDCKLRVLKSVISIRSSWFNRILSDNYKGVFGNSYVFDTYTEKKKYDTVYGIIDVN